LKVLVSVLIAVGCLLAAPGTAMAVTYTVNSTGDDPDKAVGTGGCETTNAGECTLRAAIQESNASVLVLDEIVFAAAFNGQGADTIAPASLLPAITKQVSIKGGVCATEAGQQGPCAGVNATGLNYALAVEDVDGVVIEGLAITGATTGLRVVNSSQGFIGRGNWVGVKLDGGNGTGASTGIWLDPDSNNATIGGTEASERNVIVNSAAEGLDVEGADNTDVLGNYFGVKADGSSQAANGKDIEITDVAGFEATGNEVGTAIPTPSLGAPCDAGCNVISGATSYGIDLQGNGGNEEPATGPTTIQGNYVGLNAAGTAVVANASYGIWSVEAKAVRIGRKAVGGSNGEANFFAGGGTGIYHTDGEGFAARGNIFGSSPTGADLTPPGLGIFVYCLELGTNGGDPVIVDGNVFRMEGGIGIESVFANADITTNFIEGAETGIFTRGDPPGAGNVIEGNVIGESPVNGILIENDFNTVVGNAIYDSGAAGVRIQDPNGFPILSSTDNLIGGTSEEEENTIRESSGDAIEIVDLSVSEDEDSQNAVGRNKGDENAGLFIDLVGTANAGVLPPTFATLQQSSASGSGVGAFATIRVFRKAEAIPGEIESTLAETTADGSGNWKVTYPTIPTGTLVAATQTSAEGATSELAIQAASADPSNGSGGAGGGGDDKEKEPKKGKGGDSTAPQTKILKAIFKGPTAKFKFSSTEKGSTFQCKLDKKRVKKCKSPKKYKGLKPGKHVFKVWATDAAGNKDPSPAKRKFKTVSGV
jgi:CSLREA domain-containing protein